MCLLSHICEQGVSLYLYAKIMNILFSPLMIKSVLLKNRIVLSPMCQYSSEDGYANSWHLVHLGSRAVGGTALIICEASAVSPQGRITPGDLGIWKDEHIDVLQKITSFIHQNGSVAGIQLAHAGRKASCDVPWNGGRQLPLDGNGWQTAAPSAVPFFATDRHPEELTIAGIEKIINDFHTAAIRALKAGFKVLEIHAAHGYLINEFLSPLANFRTDEYGGLFENRIRLLLQVIDSVKSVWPDDLPVFVRISATDWVEGGWAIDDSIRLAVILKSKGVDLIDCSSGGMVPDAKVETGPGYQVKFAEAIRASGILTGAVGMITDASQAENILSEGKADLVFLAREFLRDPYFPLHAARELDADTHWPDQYKRAKIK